MEPSCSGPRPCWAGHCRVDGAAAIMLVGNKSDSRHLWVGPVGDAKTAAKANNLSPAETSASVSANAETASHNILTEIYRVVPQKQLPYPSVGGNDGFEAIKAITIRAAGLGCGPPQGRGVEQAARRRRHREGDHADHCRSQPRGHPQV